MNNKLIAKQIMAIQAQLDSLIEMLFEGGENPLCNHENKQNYSVMGNERWICVDCGYEYDDAKQTEEE